MEIGMARSKNSPKLKWEYKNCIRCTNKFRFTKIEGFIKEEILCKNCIFKICESCGVLHKKSRKTCSKECAAKIRAETNIKRHGAANVFASADIKIKIKSVLKDRYGADHPQRVLEIKQKTMQTNIEKYGVSNVAKSELIKERTRKSCLEKYGKDYLFQTEYFKIASRATCLERFGVKYHSQRQVMREKIGKNLKRYRSEWKESMMQNHGVDSPFKMPPTRKSCISDSAINKKRETMRRNKTWKASKPEDRLYEKLVKKYPRTQRQVAVGRWSMDFYVPEIDTYVNLNGIYWHGRNRSENDLITSGSAQDKVILETQRRDKKRDVWFNERNLKLVIVWEDEIEKYFND
jgi:very-short-patch-repair endonuclease